MTTIPFTQCIDAFFTHCQSTSLRRLLCVHKLKGWFCSFADWIHFHYSARQPANDHRTLVQNKHFSMLILHPHIPAADRPLEPH